MADLSTSFPQLRVSNSYIPTSPPKPPKATSSYARSVQDAPYTALSGIVKDGRVPERHPVFPRCRERRQVGGTNRWRLPQSLYSDLLGNAQALKAVHMPYNSSMLRIITAENPKLCTNLESDVPYVFQRRLSTRPHTTGGAVVTSRDPRDLSPSSSPPRSNNNFTSSNKAATGAQAEKRGSVPRISARSKSLPLPAGPVKRFVPKSAHCRTPKDLFLYHSKKSMSFVGPDVLLKSMGMDWELHRPFLQKSETLSQLLSAGVEEPSVQNYYHCPDAKTLDSYVNHSNFYSNDYKEKPSGEVKKWKEEGGIKPLDHPVHIAERRTGNLSVLHLDIDDPLVTKRGMAIALGNLYHDDLDVDLDQVSAVMAAAHALGFIQLIEGCAQIMLKSISFRTVCRYHLAASKYQQERVVLACERWLELNLIPKLSMQIQLREISMGLLQKILKSSRLFVYSEYSVFRALAYWLFLQMNPDIQLVPSHSTVLSFFNSLPKATSFLESDDGRVYLPLFQAIRLHGITDTCNLQDMQMMNILPQAWIISLLSQHYHALQGGGDMPSLRDFQTCAVRQGFVVDDEPHYHSEVLSLHGFHFELKAVREDLPTNTYTVAMERLKPGDPMLSFRQCERHTFSMRPDREVKYSMTVQTLAQDNTHTHTSTGTLSHNFGLGEKTCRSQVLKLSNLKEPIYVSFALLFPPS